MSFLLDTCVISEGIKETPNPQVDGWARSVPSASLFASAVSLTEIRFGIAQLPASRRRIRLQSWFEEAIMIGFQGRFFGINETIAVRCGDILAERPNTELADAMIAATALVHGLTLVTRNAKDFAFQGLSVFNPWQS